MNARIMVVDDDEISRALLRGILEEEGYEVVEASNGAEALGLFPKAPADLIVTDIFMPEMGGLEFCLKIRRVQPDVKIIAISGGGDKGFNPQKYLQTSESIGVERTFAKGFRRDEMLAAVGEMLAGCKSPKPPLRQVEIELLSDGER